MKRSVRAISRRSFVTAAAVAPAAWLRAQSPARSIAPGPFAPTWESLKQYRAPEWFRDAKFGIWAHWTAQCVPEQGDWYARQMYIQGHPQYNYHVKQLRPSLEVRLHGDRQPLEGRANGSPRR